MKQIQVSNPGSLVANICFDRDENTTKKTWFFQAKTDNHTPTSSRNAEEISQILRQYRHKMFTSDTISSWDTFSCPRMMGMS